MRSRVALVAGALVAAGCSWTLRPVPARDDAGTTLDAGARLCDVVPWTPDACPRPQVRLAHLSPDTPPFDLCARPRTAPDASYVGPLFRMARPNGLAYGQVTQYFEGAGATGPTDLRVVRGGSTNCDTPLAPSVGEVATTAPVACRAQVTLALVGASSARDAERTLRLQVFPDLADDDRERERTLVRFIHAAPDLDAVDVTLDPPGFNLWHDVYFGAVGVANAIIPSRCFGYTAFEASVSLGGTSVRRARTTGSPLVGFQSMPPPDTIHTVFLVGLASGAGDARLAALFCQDRPVVSSSDGLNPTCQTLR